MSSHEVMSVYEEVSLITGRMLDAARNSDWDELVSLEKQCSVCIDVLRARDSHDLLPEPERHRKVNVIRKILDDDRQIRDIVTPWMTHLSALINSSGTERRLNRAYGMNQSG